MRNTLKKAWNNEFVQGGAFFMVSFTLANVINLLFTFIAGRLLGPSGYGEITALMSYLMLASVPLTVITTIVTQKVSESDENAGSTAYIIEHFIWKTMRKYWYLAVLTVVVIPFIPTLTNMSFVTSMFLVPLFWALFVFSVYGAFAQGMRLFLMYSILTVISPGIKLLGPVLSQYMHNGLLTILVFLFLSFFIPFIWIYREFIVHAKRSRDQAKLIEKRILHIVANKQFLITTASILGITLLNNFDIIFVKRFFSDHDAGIYSSWSLLAKVIFYAIGPISSVSFVFFSSKKQSENHQKTLLFFIGMLIIIGIVSFGFYTTFAKPIITALFGAKYFAVLPYLGYASVFGTLYSLIYYINSFFLARKSPGALILPIMFVIYIAVVFMFVRSLETMMQIDIYFSVGILLLYGVYSLLLRK